jgi:hydroxymethylbilane synthase
MNILLGTRGSRLALWQAHWAAARLRAAGHAVEIEIIKTSGDQLENVPLSSSGTKGVFIKEIEEALLAGRIQAAVHSLKDLPAEQPEGLIIGAVPEREDPRDALISREGLNLERLPPAARVGTGSLRRQSQLRALRGDLRFGPFRGNVDTRLKKLDRAECDALVLAAAGLARLGYRSRITQYFLESEICPAVGQGALAIEVRKDDRETQNVVATLDCIPTHQAVRAERAVLRALGGGCQLPLAAYGAVKGGALHLRAVIAAPDGSEVLRAMAGGAPSDAERIGARVAEDLLRQGASALL